MCELIFIVLGGGVLVALLGAWGWLIVALFVLTAVLSGVFNERSIKKLDLQWEAIEAKQAREYETYKRQVAEGKSGSDLE